MHGSEKNIFKSFELTKSNDDKFRLFRFLFDLFSEENRSI